MTARRTSLTPQQTDILRYIALGFDVKGIARKLNLSLTIADGQRFWLMKRFGVTTNQGLCLKAIADGLVTLDELPVVTSVPPQSLSSRQKEVVIAMAAGDSAKAVSERLRISRQAVDRHYQESLRHLGLSSRIQLTHYALQHALLRLQSGPSADTFQEVSCPDCRGSGKYVGLNTVETCQRCGGTGRTADLL